MFYVDYQNDEYTQRYLPSLACLDLHYDLQLFLIVIFLYFFSFLSFFLSYIFLLFFLFFFKPQNQT